jgi:hypothetical protein
VNLSYIEQTETGSINRESILEPIKLDVSQFRGTISFRPVLRFQPSLPFIGIFGDCSGLTLLFRCEKERQMMTYNILLNDQGTHMTRLVSRLPVNAEPESLKEI